MPVSGVSVHYSQLRFRLDYIDSEGRPCLCVLDTFECGPANFGADKQPYITRRHGGDVIAVSLDGRDEFRDYLSAKAYAKDTGLFEAALEGLSEDQQANLDRSNMIHEIMKKHEVPPHSAGNLFTALSHMIGYGDLEAQRVEVVELLKSVGAGR